MNREIEQKIRWPSVILLSTTSIKHMPAHEYGVRGERLSYECTPCSLFHLFDLFSIINKFDVDLVRVFYSFLQKKNLYIFFHRIFDHVYSFFFLMKHQPFRIWSFTCAKCQGVNTISIQIRLPNTFPTLKISPTDCAYLIFHLQQH